MREVVQVYCVLRLHPLFLLLAMACLPAALAPAATPGPSASAFRNPPDSAKPRSYWWWLNGNVTKEGIHKDLEEMRRQGIAGVLVCHGGGAKTPTGPRFLSPEWHQLFRYALTEAERLGMEVMVNVCDGWDAGGPWITQDAANKKLVYSETLVDGGRPFTGALPVPELVDGYYKDVAVAAIPEKADRPVTPARVTANSILPGYVREFNFPPQDAVDLDPDTYWSSKAKQQDPVWLQYDYHEALAATSLYLAPAGGKGPRECELQSSLDGKTFTTVTRFAVDKTQAARVRFPEVRARYFRLVFPPAGSDPVQVAEAWLLRAGDEPRPRHAIQWWWFKSGNRSFWDYPRQGPSALDEEYRDAVAADCQTSQVLNLTAQMSADGRLQWNVPAGRWTILRFGYTLEGQKIRGESLNSERGYEADALDAAGIEQHFHHTAEPIIADARATGVKALKSMYIDSYELGADVHGQQPTWSAAFRKEFQTRRGYDLLPYLPALARRIVNDRETTNRFLNDFRWTIGDLMAERYWGRFAELAHQNGLLAHSETGYGTYPYPHIDGLKCAGVNDITQGEFWHGTDIMSQFNPWGNVIRSVASAAHVYGRKLTQAESFTSWKHWQEAPSTMKPVGDEAFTDGLNRIVFHQTTHQPQLDMKPGWQYGAGTHVDRNITWWEQASTYFAYLSRCQYMLQQGLFVADVAHFYGEGVTRFVPSKEYLKPSIPQSYNFDDINADVLLHRASVRDGRLTLPDGMSYRVLTMPEDGVVSPPLLRQLRKLVADGLVLVGPKPVKAPGLQFTDAEVQSLAAEMWGDCSGGQFAERKIGKGRVVCGTTVEKVLRAGAVRPDFAYREGSGARVNFVHRSAGDAEIYFIANTRDRAEALDFTFRVSGRQPEIWDPVSGQSRPAGSFVQQDGHTALPLELAPYGSLFVVFRQPIAKTANGAAAHNFPRVTAVAELSGGWKVAFDPKWGGPAEADFDQLISWTLRPEAGIRYYSGTATYRKTFDLPAALKQTGGRLALDLGDVKYVAQVRLNGKDLGAIWTKPFRVDITGVVKPAGNQLEVDVVNLWPNRLIGDASLPPEQRFGKTNIVYKASAPLLESGLLGKVTLCTLEER
jgi:hypothetical protein